MKDTTIAVDLAKNVFEIAISREAGKVFKQLRVSRPKLVSFFAKQSAATVLLEACGSAHFWARTLRRLGHDVVLRPPHLVRPYRRGSKNDRADTKALLEAYRNEEILSVPIKSVRQHTLAALHRLRSGWLSTRTARINAVRGILRELGLFIPKGRSLRRARHLRALLNQHLSQKSLPQSCSSKSVTSGSDCKHIYGLSEERLGCSGP